MVFLNVAVLVLMKLHNILQFSNQTIRVPSIHSQLEDDSPLLQSHKSDLYRIDTDTMTLLHTTYLCTSATSMFRMSYNVSSTLIFKKKMKPHSVTITVLEESGN
jgi:hypothetical protein